MRKMSWGNAETVALRLCSSIRNSGFKPDIIIAIKKGGVVPALLASYFFPKAALETVSVRHYDPLVSAVRISVVGLPDLDNKRTLIVDDVCETGMTFRKVTEKLAGKNPHEIRTACLVLKKRSSFMPDFFGVKAEKNIAMPWYSFSKGARSKK